MGGTFQLIENQSGLAYLSIPFFDKTGLTVSAFSTRIGGCSLPPYQGLNMAFHVGDDAEIVVKNRQLLCHALGLRLENLVAGNQVHGDEVAVVNRQHLGRGSLDMMGALPDTDGLICIEPNIPLAAFFADCVPVFLLDPVKKAIGLAHAGWKGTVLEIAQKTLQKMQDRFGSQPSGCLAAIGPSIGPCCYEVDARVLDMVKQYLPYAREVIQPISSQKGMLDLWQANAIALEKAGIPAGSISVSGLCTACNTQMFFSHRKEEGRTGRMAALLMLK
ncbi:MAG: peptidoglycan editing factor PgeF [Bacillota bacterium]